MPGKPKAVREVQINEVYSMLLTSQPRWQIVRMMRERHNMGSRAVDDLIAEATSRLMEELAKNREQMLAEAIAQRNALYRATMKERKYLTALGVLDSRDRIRGLFMNLPEAIALVEQAGYTVRSATESEDTDPVGELFAEVEASEDSATEGATPDAAPSLATDSQ